ncbi:MAG: UDP-N-acetylmuramate:L-alanyl-gamma-D-glutamyl-meso-diaminopimelate ligase [Gammaproteobacteria bacterium]|nr:UDP-N-acetylmuramate:L-alanyl-gamma-D-glutamyl-meso-diaminopimelate ligase [Gammaproteobacteria bacterium]
MHLFISGICGTFMGSLALLAKELGHEVSGCDANVYPPMSDQLKDHGVQLKEGFNPAYLDTKPDLVIIGNAMSRGNPVVEAVLNQDIPYTSGPQWLAEHVLKGRHVIAVAGTHGKTSTSSMVAWILHHQGLDPGYLIGGVPKNLPASAQLGKGSYFIVEADEYDSAFFDKRSKFIHYHPRTAILNNLEFDHADIFPDLAAIQTQFHYLVRTIASQGCIISPANDTNIQESLNRGCWSHQETIAELNTAASWQFSLCSKDGSKFDVFHHGNLAGTVSWNQSGLHNVHNGLAAIAAAHQAGISPEQGCLALSQFTGVKRRMEELAIVNGITLYDDFAHHPTAIATTLEGLRNKVGASRIIAIIEPRSNTMQAGFHKDQLACSAEIADLSIWLQGENLGWSLSETLNSHTKQTPGKKQRLSVCQSIEEIMALVVKEALPGDHIVIMSNGGFAGIHQKLIHRLKEAHV